MEADSSQVVGYGATQVEVGRKVAGEEVVEGNQDIGGRMDVVGERWVALQVAPQQWSSPEHKDFALEEMRQKRAYLCGIDRFSSPRSIDRLTVALNGMPVALRIRPIHGEGKGGWRRSWTHIEAALEPSRARIVVALPSHAHCASRSRISHRGRR